MSQSAEDIDDMFKNSTVDSYITEPSLSGIEISNTEDDKEVEINYYNNNEVAEKTRYDKSSYEE